MSVATAKSDTMVQAHGRFRDADTRLTMLEEVIPSDSRFNYHGIRLFGKAIDEMERAMSVLFARIQSVHQMTRVPSFQQTPFVLQPSAQQTVGRACASKGVVLLCDGRLPRAKPEFHVGHGRCYDRKRLSAVYT